MIFASGRSGIFVGPELARVPNKFPNLIEPEGPEVGPELNFASDETS